MFPRTLLLLIPLTRARDCGQEDIEKRDVSGCITVRHVKHIGQCVTADPRATLASI